MPAGRALIFYPGHFTRNFVLELLTLAGIILSASILESFLGVIFGRKAPEDTDVAQMDNLTEQRYSRLGSEYDVVETP